MGSTRKNIADRDGLLKEDGSQAGDDACRCKKTSEMPPRELLRLMMRDLAFWKKKKKN
jgi:hypothetical protein